MATSLTDLGAVSQRNFFGLYCQKQMSNIGCRMNLTLVRVSVFVCVGASLSAWNFPARAHGDMHAQIVETTRQIERDPGNAQLYFNRGEFHRAHRDWDLAQADYDRAIVLNPQLGVVDFARGSLYLEAGWLQSAKVALDRFLKKYPNHVEALVARARTSMKLDEPSAAARDYTLAIAAGTESRPDIYIERAQALTAGDKPDPEAALRGLEEGIKKLGPLITFQLYAIDIEIKQKHFEAALSRLDEVMAKSPRKESWLARRGEILQQAGRTAEAREAFEAALKAIATLPAARRQVPAMVDLEKRLRSDLEGLAGGLEKPQPEK